MFHDLPGLVYLLEGVAPGEAWYYEDNPRRTAAVIERSHVPLASALVLTDGALAPEVTTALARRGVEFPGAYKPVARLAVPFARHTGRTLTIWAPAE